MNPLWWIPIGLAAWFLVALAVALLIGPVLRRSSRERERLDASYPQSNVRPVIPLDRYPAGLGDLLPENRTDEGGGT